MSWTPRWRHVTQILANGSGENDCWPASLTRYLRERDPAIVAGDDWSLINAIAIITHNGAPDNPGNPKTTLKEAAASLVAYNVPVEWTQSYQAALAYPWSILLVDGTLLSPPQYVTGWFADPGQSNHFILWLPHLGGAANWFNDPLVPQGQDVQYALHTVATAFYGAYLLPSTNNGESGPIRTAVKQACGLKAQANNTSVALATIPAGGQVLDFLMSVTFVGEQWKRVQWRDMVGWVPASKLEQ